MPEPRIISTSYEVIIWRRNEQRVARSRPGAGPNGDEVALWPADLRIRHFPGPRQGRVS